MTPSPANEASGGLRVAGEDWEFLQKEARLLAERMASAEAKEAYRRLAEGLGAGVAAEELIPALERCLQLGLESGRFRNLYGPHAEMRAARLFLQTPLGRSLKTSADEANRALDSFRGDTIQEAAFHARGPGAFDFSLQTAHRRILVQVDRAGLRVKSVEVEM